LRPRLRRLVPRFKSIQVDITAELALASSGAYPRAEVRYLPENLINDVPRIVAGLRVGQSFSAIPVPDPPVFRNGTSGTFHDKGLEGASRSTTCARSGLAFRPNEKKLFTSRFRRPSPSFATIHKALDPGG
jgi:hypothetical protein